MSEAPFVQYNSHKDSTHTLTAAVSDLYDSSFTFEIDHISTRKSWKRLTIDFDMMPLPMRLLARLNSRSAIPAQILYTRTKIPLVDNLKEKDELLNSEEGFLSIAVTQEKLPRLLNRVRAHIGVDALSCDKMECIKETNGDQTCSCSQQLLNSSVQIASSVHSILWYTPERESYPLPQCMFNCLHHPSNQDGDLHDELEFYASWSGYFKQLWKKPYLYTGYIFATYFFAVFFQQTLNICFDDSAFVRGLTFVLMMGVFCITMTMLIPAFLCGQVLSFHYILNMAQGCNTSVFVLRLSQAAAFIVTLLHPTISVTVMFIPVYFYVADILIYGKFYFIYFQLPNVERVTVTAGKDTNEKPPSYDETSSDIKILIDFTESLANKNNHELDEIWNKCTSKSASLKKNALPSTEEIGSPHPLNQLVYGAMILFNIVNLGFICILLYLLWV